MHHSNVIWLLTFCLIMIIRLEEIANYFWGVNWIAIQTTIQKKGA